MSTRRDFLKSSAAAGAFAALFPGVLLRADVDREAILRRFVDADGYVTRYDLSTPFLDGSLTYATDGRWIIRGELDGVATDGQGRRRPPVQALFERWQPGPMAAFEMPRIADLEMSLGVCPACRDRRVSVAEQDSERYAYDLDFDPDDCTIGDRTCSHCWDAIRDRPRDEFPCIVRIDGVRLMAASVQQILEIPGVRVRGVPDFQQISSKETVGALQFEGCGFQGFLAGTVRGF